MIKKCSKCGEEKPATVEYFYKNGNVLRPDCKVCTAERVKGYREENKEAILERHKVYYEENKEAILEQKKAYYEENKGVINERRAAYYEANKEAILEQTKVYRKANKEAILEQKKAYYRTPRGKYAHIKSAAKERNINFSLPFKLYESQLWGKPCHYCGCEIEVTGLDRKDSNKGYEVGNVVPCCWDCNNKKRTKPYEEFIVEVKNNE